MATVYKHNNFELRGNLVNIRETKTDKLLIISMKIWRGEVNGVTLLDKVELYVFEESILEWLRAQHIDEKNQRVVIAKGVITSGQGKMWKKVTLLVRELTPIADDSTRETIIKNQQEVINNYSIEAKAKGSNEVEE